MTKAILGESVRGQLHDQVWKQLWNQTVHGPQDELYDQLYYHFWQQLENLVNRQYLNLLTKS